MQCPFNLRILGDLMETELTHCPVCLTPTEQIPKEPTAVCNGGCYRCGSPLRPFDPNEIPF